MARPTARPAASRPHPTPDVPAPIRDAVIPLPDGRVIGLAEFGDPGGTPVFYFHGWPSSRLEAFLYHEAAARRHIRILALDRPGYGRSTFKRRRTITAWPIDVACVADALRIERFAVVGLSGGAPYALACARAMPERLLATLIISGEPPQVTQRAPWRRRVMAWGSHRTRFFVRGFFAVVAAGMRRAPGLTIALTARNITFSKRDRELWKRSDVREGFAANLHAAFAQGTRAIDEDLRLDTQPWGFQLEDVRVRVHLWHGEADRLVSIRHVREEMPVLPDLVATYYPAEGHFLVLDHLDEILATLAPTTPTRTTPP